MRKIWLLIDILHQTLHSALIFVCTTELTIRDKGILRFICSTLNLIAFERNGFLCFLKHCIQSAVNIIFVSSFFLEKGILKAGAHDIPPGTIKLHLLYNIYAENKRENMKSV